MYTPRRIRRPFATLMSAALLILTTGLASAAPSGPSVNVSAGTPRGGDVTITIMVNRAPKQIASCLYGVDAAPSISCTNEVGGSKSTTYTVELAAVSPGDHEVNVAVALKNGGTGAGSAAFSIEPPGPRTFAVAFSDTNGNHTYQSGTDRLIAALVDTNEDGTVSVGDTVETDAFPLTLDPVDDFGTFTVKSAMVTDVTGFLPGSVQVTTTSTVISWAGDPVEVVQWEPAAGGPESHIVDNLGSSGIPDAILISAGAGLGADPSDVDVSALDQSDNAFLDITFDLP